MGAAVRVVDDEAREEAGVRELALALVPRSIAGGVHTVAAVDGGDGPTVSKLKLPI